MRKFTDTYRGPFSAFLFGLCAALISFMGIGFFAVVNATPPLELWPLCLFYVVAGVLIELASNRVVYIRAFQVAAIFGWSALQSVLLWTILSAGQTELFQAFAGLTIGVMIIGLIYIGYRANHDRPYLADIPQGPFGVLDKQTGLVNPYDSEPPLREAQKRTATVIGRLYRLTPLAVGLSTLLVRGLPDSGIAAVVTMFAFVMTAGGSLGSGAFCSFLVTTLRWEHTHGKKIRVKKKTRVKR